VSAYPANSLVATGSVTAPGVNGVIASIVAPPEGVYEVAVHIALTGTAETALANLSLRENATSVANLPSLSTFAQRIEIPRSRSTRAAATSTSSPSPPRRPGRSTT
jgi:hypothetical protein